MFERAKINKGMAGMSFSHMVGHIHIPSFLELFARQNEQILPQITDLSCEGSDKLAVALPLVI